MINIKCKASVNAIFALLCDKIDIEFERCTVTQNNVKDFVNL